MRKLTLILLIFLLFSPFAQGRKPLIVYMKDGSTVYGKLMLRDPDKLIKLRTANSVYRVLALDQIDSMALSTPDRYSFGSGYFNLTEIGDLASPFYYSGNSSFFSMTSLSVININSWRFPCGLSTGIGVGLEHFQETYMPVVADFRYFFRDKGNLPFISFQAGYSVPLGSSTDGTLSHARFLNGRNTGNYSGMIPALVRGPLSAHGGYLFLPSIGLQTPLGPGVWLTLSAGYRWMRNSYTWEDSYELYVNYNRVALKVGLLFK
jgi:hypothetical protein